MRREKKQKNESTEKVRKFPRFGVLDAVIILLIVGIVVGLIFRYNVFQTISQFQNLKEYNVDFSVKNIEYTTPNYVSENDEFYFKESGEEFGKIITKTDINGVNSNLVLPFTFAEKTFEEIGITAVYPSETRIDVTGRFLCEGPMSDDGSFLLNGNTYIAPGQSYVICSEKVTLQINITSISAVE